MSGDLNLACKIIPKQNLVGHTRHPPTWREEIDKANVLRSPVVVRFWHVSEWSDPEADIDTVVLCSDYIEGGTLSDYIRKHRSDVSVQFAELFLAQMLSFVYDMGSHNVTHGDLHAKNVLVENRSDLLGAEPYAFKVTDFGVASTTGDTNFKDDYGQIAVMLRELLEVIDYQQASARDRFTFNILNDHFLARHLSETDTTRDPYARQARRLYEKLKAIEGEFAQKQSTEAFRKLATPFDYLSCEQIGEAHSLFKALYSDAFLGLSEIQHSRNNLVLTGPRGCGKSTVFKSLSLRHRCLVADDNPAEINHIGVYYRCDDLYSVFPRYSAPAREDAYDIPTHYMTATLASELLEAMDLWCGRCFPDEFGRLEKIVSNELWVILEIKPPQAPGASSFRAIGFALEKERIRARKKQRFILDPKMPMRRLYGPDVLIKLCEALGRVLTFLKDRPFYFFIDDYSMPKITKDLQMNLNRMFMQRTAHCFFKISTESPVSYVRSDIDGKAYVEGREFQLINLGLEYLMGSSSQKLQFIEDVLDRRFQAIEDYPVRNLDELVGSHKGLSHNKLALDIRNGAKIEMWGKQVLGDLCSGDIFYIIGLVGRMVSNSGGSSSIPKSGASPRVEKIHQANAIRQEAGSFLTSLRGIENGDHLVEVVTAFGIVAHSYLMYRQSQNENGQPPHLASRIEPYEELCLCDEAEKTYRELLRYSLFIEDPRGKSRRGKVVPRLYLRRSLLPHFRLTFGRRDSISLESRDIEMLLMHPKEFEKAHRAKARLQGNFNTQPTLFDLSEPEEDE